nr:immunoglobulin heavy chain junction region [Mus musculus]
YCGRSYYSTYFDY